MERSLIKYIYISIYKQSTSVTETKQTTTKCTPMKAGPGDERFIIGKPSAQPKTLTAFLCSRLETLSFRPICTVFMAALHTYK